MVFYMLFQLKRRRAPRIGSGGRSPLPTEIEEKGDLRWNISLKRRRARRTAGGRQSPLNFLKTPQLQNYSQVSAYGA